MGIRDKIMGAKLGFITPTIMKVFEFFTGDPVKEYHEREVVRMTGVSKRVCRKNIEAADKYGSVDKRRKRKVSNLQA